MKPERHDAMERVIRRLLGPLRPIPRKDNCAFWDHEKGRLLTGLRSTHLKRSGQRYNRFMRMRRRISP